MGHAARRDRQPRSSKVRLGGAYRPITDCPLYQGDYSLPAVAEDAVNLPGVQLVLEPIRDYPTGALTSHLVGYMGHIPEGQLAEYEANGYRQDEQVGLTGLETSFEDALRGKRRAGRPSRWTSTAAACALSARQSPAVPGHNLVLSLDLDLQRVATEALQEALDNSSGFTKATRRASSSRWTRATARSWRWSACPATTTTCSPRGSPTEAWNALTTDPDLPLFNRAIGGQYPPGSIFKIIVASGGLAERRHQRSRRSWAMASMAATTASSGCPTSTSRGIAARPNRSISWIHKYWASATAWSPCAMRWRSRMTSSSISWAAAIRTFRRPGARRRSGNTREDFGLDESTGIELPGESVGPVPTPNGSGITYAENWLTGDTYNMSIGQGFVL